MPICFGLDLSFEMLRNARAVDSRYLVVQASAVAPPFVAASFDLVFSLNAFHHFPDKVGAIKQVCLVRPGGALGIVSFDPRCCPLLLDWVR